MMFTERNARWADWISGADADARDRVRRGRRRPSRRQGQPARAACRARDPVAAGQLTARHQLAFRAPCTRARRSPAMVIPGGVAGSFMQSENSQMSEQLTLPAEARDRAGKGASRALRREGRVPAVVYGEKKEPLSIHVEEKLLSKMLSTGHFMNSVVMIDFEGKPHRTLAQGGRFPPGHQPADPRRFPAHRRAHQGARRRAGALRQRRGLAGPQARRRAQRRPATSWSWSATRPASRTRSTSRSTGWRSAIRSTSARSSCPRASTPANHDEDFTVATIVAPSAMKAEEEETAPAGEVPTVEGEEAEGGEAEGEKRASKPLASLRRCRNRSPGTAGGFFLRCCSR